MYISKPSVLYFLATATAGAQAFSFNEAVLKPRASCPSVWNDVVSELNGLFVSGGQCNDDARAAIRLSFHDCFSGAGCDGSLVLAQEYTRSENAGLQDISLKVGDLANKYNVGVADMIQFAGAVATTACPLGPRIRVLVGRTDSSTPAPEGDLPNDKASASTLISQFQAKGFSATDLAALVGAHSAAKQFNAIPEKSGQSLDSTPGTWDTKFYSETLNGKAPVSLDSDINLSNDSRTSGSFKVFAAGQAAWAVAYVNAMNKMTVLGNNVGNLTDCTSLLIGGTSKRDVKAADIAGRI
ncbi:class II peroxidase [Aplosporella prunicola CBS 121167]|uniref:Peroxidase n=1 Tax=Aplosporella prunicola CBS 121167 TaxID=1176127 RepID=A0A6A6B635_9PEZI|nr:class II peroxidase [Aplosporella prunicola CBS 121167]KAF2139326.1 class II peroxidase [Aplosporella prunicola CBS 121167]